MDYTLSDLSKDASRRYERQKARQKKRYKLARELGFSPSEAGVLSFKTERLILQLADAKARDGVKYGKE